MCKSEKREELLDDSQTDPQDTPAQGVHQNLGNDNLADLDTTWDEENPNTYELSQMYSQKIRASESEGNIVLEPDFNKDDSGNSTESNSSLKQAFTPYEDFPLKN